MMKAMASLLLGGWMSVATVSAIQFDELHQRLDVPPTDNIVTTDFRFTNTSDKRVKIAKYDAACSCMSLKVKGGKLAYEPGEKGVIRAIFEMGNFSGVVDKSLRIWLDDDPELKPSVVLTVTVDIPILIQIEPKTLRWDLKDPADAKTVKITMNYEEPVKIVSAVGNSDAFTTSLKTIEEGKSYELEVKPASTERQSLAIIKITTDCPLERHAIQRMFAMVREPVSDPSPERDASPIPR